LSVANNTVSRSIGQFTESGLDGGDGVLLGGNTLPPPPLRHRHKRQMLHGESNLAQCRLGIWIRRIVLPATMLNVLRKISQRVRRGHSAQARAQPAASFFAMALRAAALRSRNARAGPPRDLPLIPRIAQSINLACSSATSALLLLWFAGIQPSRRTRTAATCCCRVITRHGSA
jgi:hypothetical protein